MVELETVKMYCPKFRKHRTSEFTRWWPSFQAYAQHKEFAEVLSVTKYADLPKVEIEYESNGIIKAASHSATEKEAITKNCMALSAFVVAYLQM